ncbi:hypothetical protein [Natrinema versiforme]|uniref:DUF7305 domain-containing protein n=1 Tax=Natrinema versiforme TaxID=88724 RepID=A0A4P8WEJ2_9EURY|nr:hypothetical protein [Natrinema versiforme]QCS41679.1 hypothetical protein FEJ81_04655 [Natrinema versiforme]
MLALILLIGMVAVGSIGVLLVGTEAMASAEHQSEQERIEQAFVELSTSISSSTVSGDTSQSMELHAGERGAIAHHGSATYEIWTESYSSENETPVANGSIGTVEYEGTDGTTIAYEGGGVFHETGSQTRVLSAPPIDYNHETSTLSFPVFGLTENKSIDSGDIRVRQTDANRSPKSYIEDDHVFIEIESEYCRGWEQYFVDQAGDTTLQQACYGAENADGKVKVRLGYDDIENAFSSGVALPSEDNIGSGTGNGNKQPIDDVDETEYVPLDATIQQLRDDFKENASGELSETNSNSGGKYYVENLEGSYDFELVGDDAIVVVNDSVTTDGSGITVSECGNGDHSLKIYAAGDFSIHDDVKPTDECGEENVDTIQLYGTSTSSVDFHDSSSTFRGLLYVASDEFEPNNGDYQIDITGGGGFTFEGAVIANSIYFDSAANKVDLNGLEDSTVDVIPEGYEPAPQLTYLNLVEHEIEIRNN